MLAPHELKNKTFTKAVRGYNPAEVNEYIDFVVEKYTEIYRANNELEKKLKLVAAKLEEIKEDEESIRNTLLKAQKMGEQIILDASKRADGITASIKERCDVIIDDFKDQARVEKEELWKIRTFVLDLKKRLFDTYREHIQSLQSISVNDIEDIVMPDENKLAETVLNEVNKAVKQELGIKAEKIAEQKPQPQKVEKIIPDQNAFDKKATEPVKNDAVKSDTKKADAVKPAEDTTSNKDNKDEDPFIQALEKTAK